VKSLRLLVGLWACLAVLAAGFSVVAAAPLPTQSAASEPCQKCPDCKGNPCTPDMMLGCVSACVSVLPVPVGQAALSPLDAAAAPWFMTAVVLHSLARPPDPFPPRA
jgi:hypothetical protein